MSECRWYEFPEDNCEDTVGEEGHCTYGQITDSTAIANTPGLWAEACCESGLANDSCELFFVLRRFVLFFFFFFPRVFFNKCHADT